MTNWSDLPKLPKELRIDVDQAFDLKSLELGLWDERDRTFDYRDQNPVPYHSATPHVSRGFFKSVDD